MCFIILLLNFSFFLYNNYNLSSNRISLNVSDTGLLHSHATENLNCNEYISTNIEPENSKIQNKTKNDFFEKKNYLQCFFPKIFTPPERKLIPIMNIS